MGTWAAGPFGNDAALDYVGEIVDTLVENIESFMRSPQIDEGFDDAFAAVALLNVVATASSASCPEPDVVLRWQKTMLKCFDEQIESLSPKKDFVRRQRAAVTSAFAKLLRLSKRFHA